MKYKIPSKTIGPQAAFLIAELHEKGKTIFSNKDVEKITGLKPKSTRGLVIRLVDRGLATRLKPGLFILVPAELGHEREYLGNPYLVAKKIVGKREYYISHASAMDIHQMVTQPQLVVYTTTIKPIRPRIVLGTEFRFIASKPKNIFGFKDHWITNTEKVRVSNRERTIIDGLKQSQNCGGFSEVAKGFWMQNENIDISKLVDYAIMLDVGAVYRRLGYLLELFEMDTTRQISLLRRKLTSTYVLLDPALPAEGKFLARWRLRLNVSAEEIREVVRT